MPDPSRSSVIVFALRRGGAKFYGEQERTSGSHHDISGPSFTAFSVNTGFNQDDPNQLQAFFLLKHGQYVNVLLTNFPPGSAERLAPAVASRLR